MPPLQDSAVCGQWDCIWDWLLWQTTAPWLGLRPLENLSNFQPEKFREHQLCFFFFFNTFHPAHRYESSQRKLRPSSNSQNTSKADILPGFLLCLAQPRAA